MSNVGSVGSNNVSAYSGADAAATPQAAARGEAIKLGSDLLKGNAALAGVASGSGEIGVGARGDGAKVIQQALISLGYLSGSADGVFGRGTQASVAALQRASGLAPSGNVDTATLAALDSKLQVGAKKYTGPVAQDLVFMGMGDGAVDEGKNLKTRTATTVISDAKVDDTATLKVGAQTKTYDLTKKANCDAYVKDLGLSGAKAGELSGIIFEAGDDARDETAALAKTFVEAERGSRNIERLAISGHSVGSGVWGDHNGYFELATLGKLAKAFPAAARQVEDFGYHGCYSGGESNMEKFRGMFPNLKTAWAYAHSAPGTWSGAMAHQNRWEAATRGHDPSKVVRDLAAGTRKGENVATWNSVTGFQNDEAPRPIADLRRDYERQKAGYGAFFNGASPVADTQAGPVRDYYNSIQRLLQSRELPAAERPALEASRDQVIRLNFYDSWKGKFQNANATAIRSGFQAVGMTPPDFSTLSRKDALAQVTQFEAKLAAKNPKPAAAQTLLPQLTEGLRDMKSSKVPTNWV